jgi:hypothetical protein
MFNGRYTYRRYGVNLTDLMRIRQSVNNMAKLDASRRVAKQDQRLTTRSDGAL